MSLPRWIKYQVSGSNKIPKSAADSALVDSQITDTGSLITLPGVVSIGTTALAVSVLGPLSAAEGITSSGLTLTQTLNGQILNTKAVGATLAGNAGLFVLDDTATAQGVGGMIGFSGRWTSGSTSFAAIKAMKSDGVGGNRSADLVIANRPAAGGALVETARFLHDQSTILAGLLTITGGLDHNGTTVGLYGKAPVVQASAITDLTDSSAGTANNTVEALTSGSVYATDVAAIRNNFADLAAKVNAILAAIRGIGVIA